MIIVMQNICINIGKSKIYFCKNSHSTEGSCKTYIFLKKLTKYLGN